MADFSITDGECAHYLHNRKSCIPKDITEKIAQVLSISNKNEQYIIDEAKNKLNCDTEVCVLQNYKVQDKLGYGLIARLLHDNFKPFGPRENWKDWLSDSNIDENLKQFAKLPDCLHFHPIPFQMRDFQENGTELATINFKQKYDSGCKTFGVVLNTDYSTGKGMHWFSIFLDFRVEPFTIEYFNSSGEKALPEIKEWMIKTKHKLQMLFSKPICDIEVSKIQHQFDNSSCGVYSIYYIYSRLKNIPWKNFRDTRVPDKKMHDFRIFLFNEKKN